MSRIIKFYDVVMEEDPKEKDKKKEKKGKKDKKEKKEEIILTADGIQLDREANHGVGEDEDDDEDTAASKAIIAEAWHQRDDIIENANQEAFEILRNAAVESEELKRKTLDEAEKQAHYMVEHAVAEALEHTQRDIDVQLQLARQNAQEIEAQAQKEKEELLSAMEESCVELAFSVVRKILGYEIKTNTEALKGLIGNALQTIEAKDLSVARISQEDFDRFFPLPTVEVQTEEGMVEVKLECDPNLSSGDCIIESEQGNVDASVEKQVEVVEEKVKKTRKPRAKKQADE